MILPTSNEGNAVGLADPSVADPGIPHDSSGFASSQVPQTDDTKGIAPIVLPPADPLNLPDLVVFDQSQSELQRLDPRSRTLGRVTWSIFVFCVAAVLLAAWFLLWIFRDQPFDVIQWIALAGYFWLLVSLIWLTWYVPKKSYAATSWQLQSNGLEIRRGIWWQHRIFIPASRIQHTDVQQGPIERRFELATLVINTGGTHEPSISLAGLRFEKAEQLRDQLSKQPERPLGESLETHLKSKVNT